jgi:hypothetical protein
MSKAWSNKIMTNLRLTILAIALAFSGGVFAALDRVEEVLELEVSDVQLPSHEVDKVVVSQCVECTSLTLHVSRETVYRIGGFDAPKVSLVEFNAAIRKARVKRELLIYVGYAPDTNKVTRIVLSGSAK